MSKHTTSEFKLTGRTVYIPGEQYYIFMVVVLANVRKNHEWKNSTK